MQFASVFPDKEIIVSLVRQLSWTHILELLQIDGTIKQEFYIEMCKLYKCGARSGL